MQKAVLKIKELGVPPKGFEDNEPHDRNTIRIWDKWMDAVVDIQTPITWEEAEVLIKCCPTEHMAGVEWTMLHCIESVCKSVETIQYKNLIEQCNSDMIKDMLLSRFENYNKKKR